MLRRELGEETNARCEYITRKTRAGFEWQLRAGRCSERQMVSAGERQAAMLCGHIVGALEQIRPRHNQNKIKTQQEHYDGSFKARPKHYRHATKIEGEQYRILPEHHYK